MAKFTDILLKNNKISKEQLADAESMAKRTKQDVGDCLVELQYTTSDMVMRARAKEHGLKFEDLTKYEMPQGVVELVPQSVARENKVLPIGQQDGAITIAISDPYDLETIEKLRFILNRKVETVLSTRESILEAINKYYGQIEGESTDSMLTEFTDTQIDFTETEDDTAKDEDGVDESSAPVVRLVHLMISEAVQLRASDIHVEPFENRVRIRYRIDGQLVERDSPPRRLLAAIVSRIKILSKLDIAERRRCQDGRIKITVGEKQLDLRVSIIPTNHGQSVVMRILDKDNIRIGVRQLGLSERNYKEFQTLMKRPNGIVLVTGPTGSGKTTTLYAALNELNRPDRKIITAEDPVEYYLSGINQVEVKHDIGLNFAKIIKAMLRQAPNIILVGEMRDAETASMGIQASLTGHLVFSTLHTNDAPSAITRMVDMGVPAYLVASSVIAVLAQRLVRVICARCKEPYQPTEAELEAAALPVDVAKKGTFFKGKGCNHCGQSGYRGRIGIHELMFMTSRVREMSFRGAPTQDIRKQAVKDGMISLYRDGIDKIMRGITTIPEVLRTAKRTEEDVLLLRGEEVK
jgi:type IV pilus assembly protein PilB